MKNIVEVTYFSLVLLAFFINGCTTVYRPVYKPVNIFHEDLQNTPVKLIVHDDRKENEKIFYKNSPVVIPENPKYQALTSTKLEPSSREIIEKSLLAAMNTSGYSLNANSPIILDVSVKKFIWQWNHNIFSYDHSFTAEIELEVTVKGSDKIFIKKAIAETVERKPPLCRMGQDEDMLSECLTKTVEKLISDYNIITAIRRGYQVNAIN